MVRLHASLFGVAAAVVIHSNDDHKGDDIDQIYANLSSVASTEVVQILAAFSDTVFDPALEDNTNVGPAFQAISNKMDLKTATQVVDEKSLPRDVTHLVQTVSNGVSLFDESSLEKARIALNDLVEKAWVELDNKIFKCKGFQDMNRETYNQVTRDIDRLIEQINDLERMETEALDGIKMKEEAIITVEQLLDERTQAYNIEKDTNTAELNIRQNDLDVFQFILVFTKCKDATSLAQMKSQVCETTSGRKTILFSDKATATKYKKLLTPRSKRSIDMILRSVETAKSSFVQQPANSSSTPPPDPGAPVVGEDAQPCVTKSVLGVDECMKSCGPDPPDCALLHDKLSLMWGEYKDAVDALTMEMLKNKVEFWEFQENQNAQIALLATAKAQFNKLLAEARSNLAADRSELETKYSQKHKLDHQYYHYMTACKKKISWILYQDMCAIKVVRNAVLENSTACPSATIQDCTLNSWVKHECTVSCDDLCTPSQPFKCGGWAKMTRAVVTQPDQCGIQCPSLEKQLRCGQYKCPIDCAMSSWSGWSACTAECGGGLRGHTRSVLHVPKHGGVACNTVEENEACHSESCDRDCKLHPWSTWTPCSVACATGFQTQHRHVEIPTRGKGKCPTAQSAARFAERTCNEQDCNGDEICIAQQDLIIGVDGSGSVQESGFKVLKEYTKTLLKRYQPMYFGDSAMRIGLILFGNGVIGDNGQVSPAINKQRLTKDVTAVEAAVDALPFKKGFTNMAQAFSLAEDMFVKGQRRQAQQSVLLITDGKPSFKWMTNEMVEQLDDKGIMRYFIVVNGDGAQSDVMKQMKAWASKPWETNLLHVQGILQLEADMNAWAMEALVKFCPQAYSPGKAQYEEKIQGYAHVKDSGWCGGKGQVLSKNVADAAACAALATGAGVQDFLLGAFFRRGWCIAGTLKIDEQQYNTWQAEKVNPDCADGWKSSMLYDFYAMEPLKSTMYGR